MNVFCPLRRFFTRTQPATPRRFERLAFRPSLESLENRLVPSTLRVGAHQTYHTITNALTAANSGDTVLVYPGTYQEQAIITKDNITLEGVNHRAIIKAPPVLAPNTFCIVEDAGGQNVTISNLSIEGPYTGSFTTVGTKQLGLHSGIFVANGGSAKIVGNLVSMIEDATLNNTIDDGFAILVGSDPNILNTTGTATIQYNTVNNYQSAGILIANVGSSATISHNAITGLPSNVTGAVLQQEGIVLQDGPVATISNNSVSGNTGHATPGIYLFGAGPATKVLQNTVTNNDFGIYVYQTTNATISANTVSGSTFDGIDLFTATNSVVSSNMTTGNVDNGIFLSSTSSNNIVAKNTSSSNGFAGLEVDSTSIDNLFLNNNMSSNGVFDAADFSVGMGTAGTANFWSGNTGSTDNHNGGLFH